MARVKTPALQKIDCNSPEVLSVDLFTADFEQAFQVFDPNRPLVVISEGLINYFNKNMLLQLLHAISHYGQNFKELHYLTDLYPEPVKNKLANFIWGCSKLLKWMSRIAFSFHFVHPQQAQSFFQQAGFEQVNITQPQLYFDHQISSLSCNEEHLGDLVWMIHASIKNSVD